MRNEFVYQNRACSLSLSVKKGIIQDAQIEGLESITAKLLEQQLLNKAHLKDEVESLLKTLLKDVGAIIKEFF